MDNEKLSNVLDRLEITTNEISEMGYEGYVVANKINKYIREKRDEIDKIIWLNERKNQMKPTIVDNHSIIIPKFFEDYDTRIVKCVDGVLFSLPKEIKRDNEGIHHFHISFYKKFTDEKHANLRVRFLDGDRYGERFFISYRYFKGVEYTMSHYSKDVGKNFIPEQFEKEVKLAINECVTTLGLVKFEKFLK